MSLADGIFSPKVTIVMKPKGSVQHHQTLSSWVESVLEANCIRQPVSFLFLLLFSSFLNKEKRRKQGSYFSVYFIQLASDTKISHATRLTTLWPNCFYSVGTRLGSILILIMLNFST